MTPTRGLAPTGVRGHEDQTAGAVANLDSAARAISQKRLPGRSGIHFHDMGVIRPSGLGEADRDNLCVRAANKALSASGADQRGSPGEAFRLSRIEYRDERQEWSNQYPWKTKGCVRSTRAKANASSMPLPARCASASRSS